ncbi:SMI1/KNR4 family protein [Streptomyces sp. V4-01]|uniref:SMI1/KNR4 family protein n=1 Tax=Actinacidiphila polyblastidii TaxID=3110430 RepID=A0ABU7P3V7_9ACTN|nr:SMI1/KNR4 family protein [Streptomyces sp. V4-01]
MTPSLDRLSRLVPPPSAPQARDWAAAEDRIGRPLPRDFKELVDVYGGGDFDGHLGLLVPPPTRTGSEIAGYNDDRMDELNDLWAITENRPAALAGEDLLLVTWADTIDSDSVNWRVEPGRAPEEWAVVVLDADLGACEVYPMTGTEFLAGLLSGEIDSPILSHHLHADGHVFRPYPAPTR